MCVFSAMLICDIDRDRENIEAATTHVKQLLKSECDQVFDKNGSQQRNISLFKHEQRHMGQAEIRPN